MIKAELNILLNRDVNTQFEPIGDLNYIKLDTDVLDLKEIAINH